MRTTEIRDHDGVVDGVGHLAGAGRRSWRMRRELAADKLEVRRVRAKGVDDPAVPAREARTLGHRGAQTLDGFATGIRHRHALHDQVDRGHRRVGVHLGRLLDAHLEAVFAQERNEQVRAVDRVVSLPATPNHERALHRRHSIHADSGATPAARTRAPTRHPPPRSRSRRRDRLATSRTLR